MTIRSATRCFCLAALLSAALAAGCAQRSTGVPTRYGRRGGDGANSVNGTSVLARMFASAGHRVVGRGTGNGKIEDCKIIVWAPDRYTPPTMAERKEIHQWLADGHGRTFIYIGRDYDAAIDYWEQSADGAAKDESADPAVTAEYLRRLADTRSRFDTDRVRIPVEENAEWFIVRRDQPRVDASQLGGPWSDGIDAKNSEITNRARLDLPTYAEQQEAADVIDTARDEAEALPEFLQKTALDRVPEYDPTEYSYDILLAAAAEDLPAEDPFDEMGGFPNSGSVPLVTRVNHPDWSDGAVVVVSNGSFLLNLPLVNHEHRKLAGRLIDECGNEPDSVAFWDANTFSPSAATARQQDQWGILTEWPLNFLFMHLAVLGIVYVMWRFPIFGPAKKLPPPATSDFSNHINALGDLMASTREAGYARAKLQAYRVNVRGDNREPSAGPLTQSPKFDAAAMEFQNSDAMAEYRRGDFHQALRLVNRMIDAQPRRLVLWQFKAECLFKLERYDEAISAFQQLQDVGGPQAAEAFLWISLCHHNAGRSNEARNVLQQFISHTDDPDPELLSKAKAALGKLQDAVKTR